MQLSLGITTTIQLFPYKYGVLINKLPHQKINQLYYSCKLELIMNLLYDNLYTFIYICNQPCLIFLGVTL